MKTMAINKGGMEKAIRVNKIIWEVLNQTKGQHL